MTSALIAMVGLGLLGASSLAAQSTDNSAPPMSDAVVAHLSAMSGNVSTSRSDTGTWAAGALNTPLVTGDKVAAGAGGRAEVQIDYADFLRLGDNANATLANLTSKQIQVQLGSGLADYVVLKGYQAISEIDTPNIAIYPQKAGVYRILVTTDNQTQVIVRKGEAEISTPQGSTRLKQGQQITVEGTTTPEYQITDAPGKDSWDRWNETRDDALEVAQRDTHVNQYYTGSQELNQYGYWTYVPGYGQVWIPNSENSNWTPYSDGRWTWEPYWGWTWVTYEPWGWAPFHYGRWFVYGPRWVWWPGPVTPFYQPIWAPAYVSFFGFGVGFGSIGWMPIGPGDYYNPWWGGGGFYSVSYTNIYINNYGGYGNRYRRRVMPPLAVAGHERVVYSNLNEMRTNSRVRAAMIRVPQTQFAHGGIQGRERVSVTELHSGSVLGGTLPVVPNRASLSVHRTERPVAAPAHQSNHFFGARGTVAAEPRFTQERANVERDVHGASPARAVAPHDVAPRAAAPERTQHFESSGTLRPQAGPPVRAARPGFQPFRPSAQAPREMPQQGRPQAQPQVRPQAEPQAPARIPHQAMPNAPAPRPNGNGWQHFTRQPDEPQPGQSPRAFTPREQQPQDRGFTPREQPSPQPEAQPREATPQRFSRPPLQMGHPIVSAPPRYNPPPQIPHYSAPRMNEPHYSAPRMSVPHYSAPRMEAPHVSAPHVERGGGGPSHPHQR